jgi:hypothetical protein
MPDYGIRPRDPQRRHRRLTRLWASSIIATMAIESTGTKNPRVEQRASRRRNVPLRCWLSDGVVDRYAALADVSLDGARVVTVAPPPVGTTVALRFRLQANGADVRAVARIVWRTEGFRGRGGVVGVHFANVVGAEAIAAFVEEG